MRNGGGWGKGEGEDGGGRGGVYSGRAKGSSLAWERVGRVVGRAEEMEEEARGRMNSRSRLKRRGR